MDPYSFLSWCIMNQWNTYCQSIVDAVMTFKDAEIYRSADLVRLMVCVYNYSPTEFLQKIDVTELLYVEKLEEYYASKKEKE